MPRILGSTSSTVDSADTTGRPVSNVLAELVVAGNSATSEICDLVDPAEFSRALTDHVEPEYARGSRITAEDLEAATIRVLADRGGELLENRRASTEVVRRLAGGS